MDKRVQEGIGVEPLVHCSRLELLSAYSVDRISSAVPGQLAVDVIIDWGLGTALVMARISCMDEDVDEFESKTRRLYKSVGSI